MFETEFSVEWGDCDAAGIVYYPAFFDWFDRTFQRWLRSRGMSQRTLALEFGIIGTALVDAGARFTGPLTFGDQIIVCAKTGNWEEKRFRIDYEVMLNGRSVANGHEARAFATKDDSGKLRGLAIPPAFKERLEGRHA